MIRSFDTKLSIAREECKEERGFFVSWERERERKGNLIFHLCNANGLGFDYSRLIDCQTRLLSRGYVCKFACQMRQREQAGRERERNASGVEADDGNEILKKSCIKATAQFGNVKGGEKYPDPASCRSAVPLQKATPDKVQCGQTLDSKKVRFRRKGGGWKEDKTIAF